jgi:hypothetical protein
MQQLNAVYFSEPGSLDLVSEHLKTGLLPLSAHHQHTDQGGRHNGPVCLQHHLPRGGCQGQQVSVT